MDKILGQAKRQSRLQKVHTVNDYARYIGTPKLHPLVSVIHYDELEHCRQILGHRTKKVPTLRKKCPEDSVQTNILVVIFFILVDNIKYGGDIFFILDENKLFQPSVGRFTAKREEPKNVMFF